MTVADEIRALAAQGLSRAEIARRLGKSYQHVRNVLEGDRLQAAAKLST
jgi:transcriptional regulator with XRE-family HTH domain